MPSDLFDTNAVEMTWAQSQLRLVPATKPKVRIEVFILGMNGAGTPSYHASALAAGPNDCLVEPSTFECRRVSWFRFFHQSP